MSTRCHRADTGKAPTRITVTTIDRRPTTCPIITRRVRHPIRHRPTTTTTTAAVLTVEAIAAVVVTDRPRTRTSTGTNRGAASHVGDPPGSIPSPIEMVGPVRLLSAKLRRSNSTADLFFQIRTTFDTRPVLTATTGLMRIQAAIVNILIYLI